MFIDYGRLEATSFDAARSFARSRPHRHLVLDDFLTAEAAAIGARIFAERGLRGTRYDGYAEKRTLDYDAANFPAFFRDLCAELRGSRFRAALERIAETGPLSDDPRHVEFGLIQTEDAGHHGVHVDPNMHHAYDVYRRLTMLIYFSPDWRAEYGGDLELYDARCRAVEARIAPQYNRAALMECRDDAYHGVARLRVPPGTRRSALISTYFSPEPGPGQARGRHDVRFYKRPGESLRETVGYVRYRARTLVPRRVRALVGRGSTVKS